MDVHKLALTERIFSDRFGRCLQWFALTHAGNSFHSEQVGLTLFQFGCHHSGALWNLSHRLPSSLLRVHLLHDVVPGNDRVKVYDAVSTMLLMVVPNMPFGLQVLQTFIEIVLISNATVNQLLALLPESN